MSSHNGGTQPGRLGHNGKVIPAAYPPPVDSRKEFVKRGLDAEDELIDVGVAIVGGGTAGLACANRLLQILADDPETMERLGEVPVAVVEKAKTCGGHNLSGAVMRPGALQELFPDMTREQWREEGFAFGEVTKEAVYLTPTSKLAVRIPTPPPFKNHGNEVISVSALARYQQKQAEDAGAYILTETAATQLIVENGAVVGVRSGDKGRGKDSEPLGNFEPGTDIKAEATVLAEGCWGHLTGAAIKEFDLAAHREPQVWELGVKEVWKVPKPLNRLIHTMGPWPLKISPKYGQIGGTWIYPMTNAKGEHLISIGFVVELEYADATTSAHDLLQTFKTHSLVRSILEGGERVAWGAKALPGGGYWSMPKLTMPGALLVGDSAGMVDTMALKGVHHCIKSGMLAAESIYAALKAGSTDLTAYEQAIEHSSVGKELWEVRNARQPLQKGLLLGGPLSGIQQITKGKLPGRESWHRNDAKPMFIGNTSESYVKPDGKYTFDKLSSVFITGNATRDDAPNHIRVQKHVPREIAETWRWMCPAGVYEIPEDGEGGDKSGPVDVIVNYTNCVQCGAITAKGGRLTTPEGGDGPLYQIT
ncbi:MAG TPA: electron-transfer flavoprotein:ubiquinone oxidoreductase [Solirubrobacteraceae bacterium]|nr:electron-transfer flavoprotein:ubiquinone oxidoreductase [Solirubrobacteraceae bacterium]